MPILIASRGRTLRTSRKNPFFKRHPSVRRHRSRSAGQPVTDPSVTDSPAVTDPPVTDPPVTDPPAVGDIRAVVGVGASAGGLQPLREFLSQVPPRSGMAFLIKQHLDPAGRSMLVELLQRVSPIPVSSATHGQRIEPDHAYVVAPGQALAMTGGVIHLTALPRSHGMPDAIDRLFESLALEYGSRSVAVLFSGMGADGTRGMRAVKDAGGRTFVQSPSSAQFDSMPSHAIASGVIDRIALPHELPALIISAFAPGASASPSPGIVLPPQPLPPADEALGTILALLRDDSGHDFSFYKTRTLERRIERRIDVHELPGKAEYTAFLRANPQERALLFRELLIGVTGFFRDTPVWQALRERTLPTLLAQVPDGQRLRAWVVGCSTGEEAYSLAMVFCEVLDEMPSHARCTLQIFATDLSPDAIDRARRGLFPAGIAGEMSAQRLARFFVAQDDGYRIDKRLRDTIIFAPHDVIRDPPFTRLDLISCRNLLIYFKPALQRALLPLFHYSLRPGGVLLLGNSESLGRFDGQFESADPKLRIYNRPKAVPANRAPSFPVRPLAGSPLAKESRVPDRQTPAVNLQATADQLLLQNFSPPAVLVNDRGDILYINGRTGQYLEPAAGKANWNIHVMARGELRAALSAALLQASTRHESVEILGLLLNEDGQSHRCDVLVRPLQEPGLLQGNVLVVFRPASVAQRPRRRRAATTALQQELETEVQQLRDQIQTLREDMRVSQEELQASNEELQSNNEELQSTNEEMTSSKEEMQSMNEELQAVNAELLTRVDELAMAQSDMRNLLNSIDIATLFLDGDLNVRRYTEQSRKIFSLREADVGRPISDLSSTLIYPALQDDIREVLRTLVFCEKSVSTTDGHWFTARIKPYRALDDRIKGVVITFVDITTAKQLEARLAGA